MRVNISAIAIAARPLLRWIAWLLFLIAFYRSGETFTVWLLQPERLQGGLEWLRVALFPLLLPAFFLVNRHWGCVGGACRVEESSVGLRWPSGVRHAVY